MYHIRLEICAFCTLKNQFTVFIRKLNVPFIFEIFIEPHNVGPCIYILKPINYPIKFQERQTKLIVINYFITMHRKHIPFINKTLYSDHKPYTHLKISGKKKFILPSFTYHHKIIMKQLYNKINVGGL